MKRFFNIAFAAVIVCSVLVISVANADDPQGVVVSVLKTSPTSLQDQDPPAPQPVLATQESVSDQAPPAMSVVELEAPIASVAGCCGGCQATPCCCQPRCCKPVTCCCKPAPPVLTEFCLVDPCGCTYTACICLPADCVGQVPCITWRGGVFGRQVATMCWDCCDHKVKVIITRKGKVKVRG